VVGQKFLREVRRQLARRPDDDNRDAVLHDQVKHADDDDDIRSHFRRTAGLGIHPVAVLGHRDDLRRVSHVPAPQPRGESAVSLVPGLSTLSCQRVADVIGRIGGVLLGRIMPVFMSADVSAVRALNPQARDLHAEAASLVVPQIVAEHGIQVMAASWCCGFALGLRMGRRFGHVVERPRHVDIDPDDRPRSYTRRIEKLIGLVAVALGTETDPEVQAARKVARDMGRLARRLPGDSPKGAR
jgi:hypothetical protein